MIRKTLHLLLGTALLAFAPLAARGQILIISDDYNVSSNSTGFALDTGVNSGINPPTTRLTGTAAAGLRYFMYSGSKLASLHSIATNRFQVLRGDNPSVVTLGPGTGAYDFSIPLRSPNASPATPSVYEIRIKMLSQTQPGNQRFSFGLTSDPGGVTAWDFGLQLTRPAGGDSYMVQRRIDMNSSGLFSDLDTTITNMASGTYGTELSFLIKVTDAGTEVGGFNSRVQVSLDEGATWFYDTQGDSELLNGWRLDTAGRYFFWDFAGFSRGTIDDFSVTWISGPEAFAEKVWAGNGGDDNWSTGANWQDGSAPSNGDMLIFNGSNRQANVNDLTSLLVPWLMFNNGGFTLSGNEVTVSGAITNLAGNNTIGMNMSWATASAKSWMIASNSEVALNGSTTVDVNGNHTLRGGGTIRIGNTFTIGGSSTANPVVEIADGRIILDGPFASFNSRGGFRIGVPTTTPTVSELILNNGANMNLALIGAALRVGDSINSLTNRLLINNSSLTMTGGDLGLPWAGGTIGEIIQVGGTLAGCDLNFNQSGLGYGTYRISNGGVLEPRQITKLNPGGSSAIYFDNATLRTYSTVFNDFMSGVDVAEIEGGGLTLDVITADVTLSAPFSGVGALTKSGFFAANLTGTNTYAGNTVIQAGKLVLPTVQTNAGTIQVADSTELGISLRAQDTTLTAGGLTLGTGGATTLSFDLGAFSNPTAPLMEVTSLSASGTVTVNISGGSPTMQPGTITLIKYSGAIAGGFTPFVKGSLPAHLTAELVNNPGSIDLVISAVQGFRWTGAEDSNWDGWTLNWFSGASGQAAAYTDGFSTEFRDGANTGIVNLNGSFSPAILTVSNSALAYDLSGGSINTPVLKKIGDGTVTRTDGFDTIPEIELNEGTYVVNNNSDATFTSLLTDTTAGTGTFAKNGFGTLTMTLTNSTYDGAIQARGGVLKLGATGAFGSTAGGTVVLPGASLDLNNLTAHHEPVIASGAGYNGQGAIYSGTGGTGLNLTQVELAGHTVFGSPTSTRWDIRSRLETGPAPGLNGNGYDLTKIGGGQMIVACQRTLGTNTPYWDLNLGDLIVQEGWMSFEESLHLGNPAKKIMVFPGATVNFRDLGFTNPVTRSIYLTNANLDTAGANASTTNVFDGPIYIDGIVNMAVTRAFNVFNGAISGNGSLNLSTEVTTGGRTMLNGINTFTGDTTLTSGTLGGSGSIAGNLVMTGGTLAPGYGIGTFTVGGNATIGNVTMELAPGQSPNSDKLSVAGAITASGTLTVTLPVTSAAPQGGDTFQLFNQGVSGFANITLPVLGTALAWDTSTLATDGSIRVLSTAPSFGTVSVSNGQLSLNGTGGTEGGTYYIVTSPDITAPMPNWIPVATNVYGPGGSFSFTVDITEGGPQSFFRVQSQ